jgi:glucose/arabinose dehydrogenase
MAFLPNDDFDLDLLVLERRSGKVRHFRRDSPVGTTSEVAPLPLDLKVNSAGTRGLLGIALHPDFANPLNRWVYLFWTETTASMDSNNRSLVPVFGNRVDRYLWNGFSLTFDRNLINLRALQEQPPPMSDNQAPASHNGGVLRFGPDGKLYVAVGDVGRRGWMQNLECGTALLCPGSDDNLGGPQPDDKHLTGIILRLNDDGTTPKDNPFYTAKKVTTGNHTYPIVEGSDVAKNIQKIFAYGIRNPYGMALDPASGNLWLEENGEDSFSELHRLEPGQNGGWVQIRGPLSRIAQYKAIETGQASSNECPLNLFDPQLEQGRFSPDRIADTPEEALSRLVMIEGAHYRDPEFSWKFEVAPAGIGFMKGRRLGPQYENDLFVGAFEPEDEGGGYLFHFNLTGNRQKVGVNDPELEDRVADNLCMADKTESESLLFGQGFGIGTDIQTGPNGNLFVVSTLEPTDPSSGAIYEIFRRH